MLCVQSAANESQPEGSCLACSIRNHRKVEDRICSFLKDSILGGGAFFCVQCCFNNGEYDEFCDNVWLYYVC